MPEIKFTAADVGCYLDGHMGWHNSYRVVEMAEAYGFHVTPSEREFLDAYREGIELEDESGATPFDVVAGQDGLAEHATDFLQGLTADDCWWDWDMGELRLVTCDGEECCEDCCPLHD